MTDRIAEARRLIQTQLAEDLERLKSERTRARGALNRRIHEARQMLSAPFPYASQAGQDVVVDRIFDGRRGGSFLDIGGYDGVTGSNTLFFETRRGWSGVLVEPVPAQFDRAEEARRCLCLPYAVAAQDGEADFIEISEGYTQMSGLAGSYDPDLLSQVRADPRHVEQVIRVQTRTLSAIMEEVGVENPDFVSLDIEGGEAAALAAFPFDRHRVRVWAIENNTGGPEIAQIMQAHGHELVELCGPDEIWRRRDL